MKTPSKVIYCHKLFKKKTAFFFKLQFWIIFVFIGMAEKFINVTELLEKFILLENSSFNCDVLEMFNSINPDESDVNNVIRKKYPTENGKEKVTEKEFLRRFSLILQGAGYIEVPHLTMLTILEKSKKYSEIQV